MQGGSTKQPPHNQAGGKSDKISAKSASHTGTDNDVPCEAAEDGASSPGVVSTSDNHGNNSQPSTPQNKRKSSSGGGGQGEEKTSGSQKKTKISKTPVPSASGTASGVSEGSTGPQTKVGKV